jgi:tetratricopeptide (TPR) repeat protein
MFSPTIEFVETVGSLSERYYYEGKLEAGLQVLALALDEDLTVTDKARLQLQQAKLFITGASLRVKGMPSKDEIEALLLSIRDCIHDQSLIAEANLLLGRLYYWYQFQLTEKNIDTPLTYFQQAHETYTTLSDQRGICETLLWFGLIEQVLRQRDAEALPYFQQALELADHFKREKSYIVRHLAYSHQQNNRLEEACELFEQSAALREEIGYKVYLPFSYIALGDIYAALKQNALPYYEKALTLAQDLGNQRAEIMANLSLGVWHRERHYLETALAMAEREPDLIEECKAELKNISAQ